jgi:hypothetical protein
MLGRKKLNIMEQKPAKSPIPFCPKKTDFAQASPTHHFQASILSLSGIYVDQEVVS